MLNVLKRPAQQHDQPLPNSLDTAIARLQALTPRRRELDELIRELQDRHSGVLSEAQLRLGRANAAEDEWLARAGAGLVRGQRVEVPAEIREEVKAAEQQLRAAQRAVPGIEAELEALNAEQAQLVPECARLERRIVAEISAALYRRHQVLLHDAMRLQAAATGLWRWLTATRDGDAQQIADAARLLPFDAKQAIDAGNNAVFTDWLAGAADLVADPFNIPSPAEISGRLLSAGGDGAAAGGHTARRANTL